MWDLLSGSGLAESVSTRSKSAARSRLQVVTLQPRSLPDFSGNDDQAKLVCMTAAMSYLNKMCSAKRNGIVPRKYQDVQTLQLVLLVGSFRHDYVCDDEKIRWRFRSGLFCVKKVKILRCFKFWGVAFDICIRFWTHTSDRVPPFCASCTLVPFCILFVLPQNLAATLYKKTYLL